jgi:predicted GIY-YIG superfamily endonuclease
MAIIYKITNDINNKVYVGKTTRDLNTRFNEHKKSKNGKSKSAIRDAI